MSVKMRFIGRDSHSRPVYQDDSGNLYKDTDPRSHVPPCLFTVDDMEGSPKKWFPGKVKLLPKRDTW